MRKITAVDMFCGAGGESTGLTLACQELGMDLKLSAINHWERAIETHSRNHPEAEHHCESIQNLQPDQVIRGGRVNFLWASPECTHHSIARGGRPCSDQSRASAWLILKWLSDLYVDRIIVENVPEFLSWGPLGANGQPLQSKKGETFRAWVRALEAIGYRVDRRVLTCANYGDPTTRRRLFVQAVRGRKRIIWPQESHSQSADMFAGKPWRSAREVIDWTVPSQSIFARKKPLAENTMKRIEHGIRKYWGPMAEPFLVVLRGTGTTADISKPLPTVTAGGGHLGLVEPFVIGQQSGAAPRTVSNPSPTISTAGAISLVEPFLVQYYGNGQPRDLGNPLDTVTCNDRFALVDGCPVKLDIRFRMLKPHELAAAHSFPGTYDFAGGVTDQVKQIGNSVPVNTAKALCLAALGGAA